MTCKEIHNLLPAYLEDILSPEEKKSIESHLASCSLCRRYLDDLKKAESLVKGLGEVEPPPFFEQRIMARVREEAGQKKGILRKFFYPLHIKIPIQALAAILVTVLAFYVYQKNEPEMKHLTPFLIPLNEPEKGQIAAKSPKILPAPSAVTAARRAPAGDLPDKKQEQFAAPPFGNKGKADRAADWPAPIQEERASTMKPGAPIMAAREKELPPAGTQAMGKAQDRVEKQEVGKVLEALPSEQKRKGRIAETGVLAEEDRMMKSALASTRSMVAPAKKQPAVDITIQVKDANVALREIEERLGQVNARIIERQYRQGRGFLKVEIAAQKVPAFLDRLEAVGKVDADKNSLDLLDEKMTFRLTIVTNP